VSIKESTWVRITLSEIRVVATRERDVLIRENRVELLADDQDPREPEIARQITGLRINSTEINAITHRAKLW